MKFKIHTKEIRKIAKKKHLKLTDGLTIESSDDLNYTACCCPVGALYLDNKNIDCKNKDELAKADIEALKWGRKKLGKQYCNGFMVGFDNLDPHLELKLLYVSRKRDKDKFMVGYNNGKLLRKTLVESEA